MEYELILPILLLSWAQKEFLITDNASPVPSTTKQVEQQQPETKRNRTQTISSQGSVRSFYSIKSSFSANEGDFYSICSEHSIKGSKWVIIS